MEQEKGPFFVGSNPVKGLPQEKNWTESATGHLSDRNRMRESDDPILGEEVDKFRKNLPSNHSER